MDTWWAVRLACGETSSNPAVYNDPNIRWLLDHAPVEVGGITVSGSPDTRWNVGEKMQETDWYTTSGSGTFTLELDGLGIVAKLSDSRTITSTTSGIPVGTAFKLCAGPEKDGTVTVPIKATGVAYASLMFIPASEPDTQSVVAGASVQGQGQEASASANFVKRVTYPDVQKTDNRHLALDLSKTQPSGDASLDGAVFGLYKDPECTQLVTQATVTNGIADFGAVVLGDYFYKEISAGNGYKTNETVYPVTVWTEGMQGVTEIPNDVKTNPVSIVKYAITDPDNVDDVLNQMCIRDRVACGILTETAYIAIENIRVVVANLSLPTRYTHSPVEVINLEDALGIVTILERFLMGVDEKTRFGKDVDFERRVKS